MEQQQVINQLNIELNQKIEPPLTKLRKFVNKLLVFVKYLKRIELDMNEVLKKDVFSCDPFQKPNSLNFIRACQANAYM